MIAISRLLLEFLESEKTAGLLLVLCTVISLLIANSSLGDHYVSFWHRGGFSLFGVSVNYPVVDVINDALMAIFFLLVGLEIERELYKGELSGIKNALLPAVAAFGGMIVPALIHFSFNAGSRTQSGFGIPMATDIAFALGILSLAGKGVPVSLKILLTALAIIDDIGAILVIAIFYAHGFSLFYFAAAMVIFAGLVLLNRLNITALPWYLVGGLLIWFSLLRSGIHPTIAGVLLAFAIPFEEGDEASASCRMEHFIGKPVAFVILPIFALANTAIVFDPGWYEGFLDRNTAGIMAGLIIGKPLGIVLFTFVAVKMGLGKLAQDLRWQEMFAVGILGGIGFTMSIFIANLAFRDAAIVETSKIAIFGASAIAAIAGLLLLYAIRRGSMNPGPGGGDTVHGLRKGKS